MHIISKFLKSLLRSLFTIIVFLLFIGWAKMDWNAKAYVQWLNVSDWSVFHRSQPGTWVDPFWPQSSTSGSIADMLADDQDDVSELSGLDVYDPAFEEDLNDFPDEMLSGDTEESFGFTTEQSSDGQQDMTPSSGQADGSGADSKTQLLNLIKQREMSK